MIVRSCGWPIIGLALLASVGGGILIGQQVSAEMDPFYAHLAATMPSGSHGESVQPVETDASSTWIKTSDLSYSRAASDPTQASAY